MGYVAQPVAKMDDKKFHSLELLDQSIILDKYRDENSPPKAETCYVLRYPASEYIEITKSQLEWALSEVEKYEAKKRIEKEGISYNITDNAKLEREISAILVNAFMSADTSEDRCLLDARHIINIYKTSSHTSEFTIAVENYLDDQFNDKEHIKEQIALSLLHLFEKYNDD